MPNTSSAKIIYSLVIVLLLTSAAGCRPFTSPPVTQQKIVEISHDQVQTAQKRVDRAILSLVTDQSVLTAEEQFKVDIILDTQSLPVDGADIILRYDPLMFQIITGDGAVVQGDVFDQLIAMKTDNRQGRLGFSDISEPHQTFNGLGLVASVYFKAIASGQGEINFDFTIDSTSDTNVASNGQDVLGSTESLILNVQDSL